MKYKVKATYMGEEFNVEFSSDNLFTTPENDTEFKGLTYNAVQLINDEDMHRPDLLRIASIETEPEPGEPGYRDKHTLDMFGGGV